MTIIANLAGRATKNTGVTPELAQEFFDHPGRTRVAIVELTASAYTVSLATDPSVKLDVTMLEVAPQGDVENFLRDLSRAFYQSRDLQESLGDEVNPPSAEDVIERIRQYFGLGAVPEEKIPADAGMAG